ncbi:hypothetical protein HMI54_014497 [Coelomomyces lativittatus]|nr:hypothetical protein HMI56_004892 [Coelomomyces lativittatus]KAJ1507582.1 hypothetical protein HMI55_000724 [Coelomomyces lativittatus]KAJ1514101.1 hypothetical protein HMI54_014497 [Coelomomyces lativittatus]
METKSVVFFFNTSFKARNVFVTGDYDNWETKTRMELYTYSQYDKIKNFRKIIQVPYHADKVVFKFIQDGVWKMSSIYEKIVSDTFHNNVIYFPCPNFQIPPPPYSTISTNFKKQLLQDSKHAVNEQLNIKNSTTTVDYIPSEPQCNKVEHFDEKKSEIRLPNESFGTQKCQQTASKSFKTSFGLNMHSFRNVRITAGKKPKEACSLKGFFSFFPSFYSSLVQLLFPCFSRGKNTI